MAVKRVASLLPEPKAKAGAVEPSSARPAPKKSVAQKEAAASAPPGGAFTVSEPLREWRQRE